jgi:hypothetical protein
VLDTVLVVDETITHTRDNWSERLADKLDELAVQLTLRPMYAWRSPDTHTALLGASPDAPVDGMFSFVPCLPAGQDQLHGFPRPSLNGVPGINERNCVRSASTT